LIPAKLPHSDDAERAVLGGVILDNAQLEHVRTLDPSEFFGVGNGLAWRAILSLAERGVALDLVTVRDELERTGNFGKCGGVAYLAGLVDGTPRSANVAHYAQTVRRDARKRALAKRHEELSGAYRNGKTDDELAELERDLAEHARSATGGTFAPVDLATIAPSAVEYAVAGLIRRSGVTLVYGPSSVGKTFALLRLASELLASPGPVPLFSHPDLRILEPWRRVVWVSAEESGPVLRNRWDAVLAGLGLTPSDLAGSLVYQWAHTAPRVTLDRAESVVESAGVDVDALVLDSFTALAPASLTGPAGDRDGGNFATRPLFDSLRELAVRRSLNVFVVHHEGKDPTKGPRGASELVNASDTVIRLEPRGGLVGVTVEKQRDGRKLPPFALRFTFEPGALDVRHEPNGTRAETARHAARIERTGPSPEEQAAEHLAELVRARGRMPRGDAIAETMDALGVGKTVAHDGLALAKGSGSVVAVKAESGRTNALDLVPGTSEASS
jgi:hypothetical protein